MPPIPDDLSRKLRQHGQEHALAFYDRLDERRQETLLGQLRSLELEQLARLYAQRGKTYALPPADRIRPVPFIPYHSPQDAARRELGERALRQGKVAALVVAGGQGSRLGFEHPKGMFAVGPVSKKSLFAIHCEKVLATARRYQTRLPLLVMTSPATHDETLAYFLRHEYFGLPACQVFFFQQGTMPALDLETGKLLLEAPDRLFLGPDGHGGTLTALASSGLLAQMKERGVEQIFYFQVDNPLVKIADPTFLGHHLAARAEVSSKAVQKRSADEKVGVFARADGRCTMVEYSDLKGDLAALAKQTDATGRLLLWAGNPAIHLFDVAFLEQMTRDPEGIPFHVARKKVPHVDAEGRPVEPSSENALKFERFIFDVLPKAERWTVVETTRETEFAPLKNASGDDSPETVERALIEQGRDWLVRAGGVVKEGVAVEVGPLFALDAEETARKLPPGTRVESPQYFG
jgi:UDP-N-acetylglucosamine/UDP-N-acetylgalactosamine diphosphorylase